MKGFLKRLLGRSEGDDAAYEVYRSLVGQSRLPQFYLHLGVPDTLNGRFDMMILHAFLLFHRLRGQGETAQAFGQRVFDIMFDDMDQALREMGVGDLSVGKKIRTMASAFYGRANAYAQALEAFDPAVLDDSLRRNIFADVNVSDDQVARLAAYVRRSSDRLAQQPTEAILAGEIQFGPPPEAGCAPEADCGLATLAADR